MMYLAQPQGRPHLHPIDITRLIKTVGINMSTWDIHITDRP